MHEPRGELLPKLLGDRKILVADSQAAARSSIAKTLRELGAKTSAITLVATYEEAVAELAKGDTPAVVCDYNLGEHCGLKLMHHLKRWQSMTRDRLFIVVTTNSRETSIAEAAEEEVDCYILKPFTLSTLHDHIVTAVKQKLDPTPYRRAIEDGKALLLAQQAQEASELFVKAIALTEKPSLAYYYHGQACVQLTALDRAEASYEGGLRFNDRHYRCLTGLYELYLQLDRHDEAYEIAKRIVFSFPVSPARLDSILRLAVKTQQFAEVESYYQLYIEMDYRTPELTKVMTAALVVAGKYYLGRRDAGNAAAMMRKGMVVSARAPSVLREIISALAHAGYPDDAEAFLKEFPPEHQNSAAYHAMDLLILDGMGTPSQIVAKGRKLLERGFQDPLIYEILIRRSFESDLRSAAETLAFDAAKRWPESRVKFLSYLNPQERQS